MMTASAPAGLETVSVIVPTFNRAAWLESTVRSALAQTHAPLEIIVVDDGSTDGTEAVARSLPAPVTYLRQENAGVAAARNAGARVARGHWLAFLDCEDLWEPRKLECQLAALNAVPDAGWSVTGCVVIDLEGRPTAGPQGFERVFPLFRELGVAPSAFFARQLTQTRVACARGPVTVFGGDAFGLLFHGNFGLPSSAMVRRTLFEALGGFDPSWRLAEETEFFHRLAASAGVALVMEPLTQYRVGQGGALTSPANTVTLVRNALTSLERAAACRALKPAERSAYAEGRTRLTCRLAYAHLSNHDSRRARRVLGTLFRGGVPRAARAYGLLGLSLLPGPILRALHAFKRGMR